MRACFGGFADLSAAGFTSLCHAGSLPVNAIERFRPDEWELYQPLVWDSMLELGGKWCSQACVTYKSVFEGMGFRHVSVDWNGEHGAVKRDLRKPLEGFGQFDMVVNMGTTEHVEGQAGVWANIHNATKVDGVYVGQTPYHDRQSWWWHGKYYPTEQFFESFAAINGWEIERMYAGKDSPWRNLYVRMRRLDDREFTMPDESLIVINKRKPRSWSPS